MSSPFILAIILNIFAAAPNYLPNEIVWTENYTLQWEDFLGQPNTRHHSDALTSSSIYFGYRFDGDRTYEIEVYSSFFRDQSWVKDGSPNSYLLEHEQRHFDLTEIYARKLKKELTEYAHNHESLERNYDHIFEKYFSLLENEQKEYDRESHHSLNRSVQEKWNKYIKRELRRLEDYSSTRFILVCNGPQ